MRVGGCLAESKASTIDSVMRMSPSSKRVLQGGAPPQETLYRANEASGRVTTRTHRMKGGRAVDVHPSGFLDRLRIEDGLDITL